MSSNMLSSRDTDLKQAAAIVVIVGGIYITFSASLISLFINSANRRVTRISKKLYNMLLRKEMSWFDENPTGELVATYVRDLNKIRHGLGETLGLCVHYAMTFCVAIVACAVYSLQVAAIALILLPIAVALRQYCMKKAISLLAEARQHEALAAAVAEEAIAGIRTVQSFNCQQDELRRYILCTSQAERKGAQREWWLAIATAAASLQHIALAMAMWIAIYSVRHGTPTFSQIIVPIISIMKAMSAAKYVAFYSTVVSASLQSLKSIRKCLALTGNGASPETEAVTIHSGRIEFRDVSFTYKSRGVRALNRVSFVVEPGKTTALVGQSGSGKSTILKLILRFYEPDSGQILIDDKPISECSGERLRKMIGVVCQEASLFNMSIAENISFGCTDSEPTDAELKTASEAANAHGFIEQLPQKYDTLVGETGSRLSGGQKQRVALARAIIRDPKILLLDEATAALDSTNERIVQKALDAAQLKRATISVAHRLSTISRCDQILVLENGVIVERGDHASLSQLGGIYSQFAKKQILQSRDADSCELLGTLENCLTDDNDSYSCTDNQNKIEEDSTDEEAVCQKVGSMDSFVQLLKLAAQGQKRLFIAAMTLCCATATLSVGFGLIFGLFITSFKTVSAHSLELYAVGGVMITSLLRTVFTIFMYAAFGNLARGAASTLGAQMFGQLLHRDAAFFDDSRHSTGSLLLRLTVDLHTLRGGLRAPLANVLLFILCHPLVAVVVCVVEWRMLPAIAAATLLNALGVWLVGRRAPFTENRLAAAERAVGQAFTETVSLISTVRSLGCERRLRERFCKLADDAYRANEAAMRLFVLRFGLLQAMPLAQAAVTFLIAAYVLEWFHAKPADVYTLLTVLALGLHSMGLFFGDVLNSTTAAASIGELLMHQPSMAGENFTKYATKTVSTKKKSARNRRVVVPITRQPTTKQPRSAERPLLHKTDQLTTPCMSKAAYCICCNIAFKDVNFAYPNRSSEEILRDLSLNIRRGQSLAIVGPSGSGKSTLLLLLQRFYEPSSGEITLDEISLRNLEVRNVRERVVAVSQDPAIFNRTILENIAHGLTNVPFESVRKAAVAAQIHEFIISLPQGYSTLAGERGCLLSGGQRQRVALARALVRSSALLCLDEATSALDAATEQRLLAALSEEAGDRTRLFVAHRLATARLTDHIAVMQRGVVVEYGTHDELMSRRQQYYAMVNR